MTEFKMTLDELRGTKDGWAERVTPFDSNQNWKEHQERYTWAKDFVFGNVLDFACGTGYGSHILAQNEKVNKVFGFDLSEKAILFAAATNKNEKIKFERCNLGHTKLTGECDCIVAFECLDHIYQDLHERIMQLLLHTQRLIFSAAINHPCPFHVSVWTAENVEKIRKDYKVITEFSQREGNIVNMVIEINSERFTSKVYT